MVARPSPLLFSVVAGEENLLSWRDDIWREHRRFALRTLRTLGVGKPEMEELISQEIAYLIGKIKEHDLSKSVDISILLAPSVSNIICAILIGKRFDYDHPTR